MHKSHLKKKCRNRHKKSNSDVSEKNAPCSEGENYSDDSKTGTYIVKQSEEFGRYIVASRDLAPGTLLIHELPLIVGPCASVPPICLSCHVPLDQPSSTPIECPSCLWPLCSPQCPGIFHTKKECELLSKTSGVGAGKWYGAIAPLRCLMLKEDDKEKWEVIMRMEKHENERKMFKKRWDDENDEVVEKIIKEWKLEYSEQDIRDVCGILQVNAFEVGRRGISVRALYPRAYLLLHNCVPNTTHTDDDITFKMSLRSSTPIRKGEPITLTYAYTLQSTMLRREHLYMGKFFWCQCQRCKDPTELQSNAGTLRCPKCHQGSVVAEEPLNIDTNYKCTNNSCEGYKISGRTVRVLMDKISDEIEALDCNDVPGFESFLYRYRNVLHSTHYHCLGVKHSLSQLYGKAAGYLIHELPVKLLNRKIEICKELMEVFDVLEPGYSRLRGMTLYELHAPLMILATRDFEKQTIGKNELRQRLQEVVHCLQKSATILGFEPENSAEQIMANAAKDALKRIKDWEKILGKIC